jgi:hypothetical protein
MLTRAMDQFLKEIWEVFEFRAWGVKTHFLYTKIYFKIQKKIIKRDRKFY